ncbi:hypothetical protein Aspvir_005306 [Aspergillus viridinutans]|uniref:Uncharacterized protein n=1 Tax=Aspergillus viridinutans TaxID=75553 RepID=A0A9P3F1C0_ASPVI|nr:uncharacterized protein Aspvir_005306 [Aspergillus viridinutans]GIK01274.1 hypothetical protein Aspvir_005306 [Aspergillus viridinutans]
MLSPTSLAYTRQAPPVRPSRSLEGLEQVVPPRVPQPPTRPTPQLDKPLPDLPSQVRSLPDASEMRASTAWSDDSSTISSVDSDGSQNGESTHSTESYPVFVRSASDDLVGLVDHPPVSSLDRAEQIVDPCVKPLTIASYSPRLSLSHHALSVSKDDRYGSPPEWAPKRAGPNHYFREKKWDFFPELATPSVLGPGAAGRFPPASSQSRKRNGSKLHLSSFEFGRNRRRSNTSDRCTLTLAHEVRDSIRSYVHRTLSKRSAEKDKSKRPGRPATAPSFYPPKCASSQEAAPSSDHSYSYYGTSREESSPVDMDVRMRTLSISTTSTASERGVESPKPIPLHRTKQLAVPITPYQKYGAAIWDKSGGTKRVSYRPNHQVKFSKHQRNIYPSSTQKSKSSPDYTSSNPTAPLSPPVRSVIQQNTREAMRVLQDGTTQVLDVLGEAKKKVIGSSVDRRRMQLKSQIKLIGPVNPYTTYGRVDSWI